MSESCLSQVVFDFTVPDKTTKLPIFLTFGFPFVGLSMEIFVPSVQSTHPVSFNLPFSIHYIGRKSFLQNMG